MKYVDDVGGDDDGGEVEGREYRRLHRPVIYASLTGNWTGGVSAGV